MSSPMGGHQGRGKAPAVAPAVALAHQHYAAQNFAQARAILLQHLRRVPSDADAMGLLAMILTIVGEHRQAEHYFLRVIAARPGSEPMRCNLGHLYMQMLEPAKAAEQFEAAGKLGPSSHEAWKGAAVALHQTREFARGLRAAERAVALDPNDAEATAILATCQLNLCRVSECLESLRGALARHPSSAFAIGTYLMTLHYDAGTTARALFDAHRELAPRLAQAQGDWKPPAPGPQDAERRLRMGIVSADLNRHVVASFLLPILEESPKDRVELRLFNTGRADDVTAYIAGRGHPLEQVDMLDDARLVEHLRGARLDVLVELNGWTSEHRLGALSRRAAPLQATYLGYPNTSGMPNIDLRLVDSVTDPEPTADALATERLARIDGCFLCYKPMHPPVDIQARAESEPVTFGCFNNAWKVNPPLLDAWARVLSAVPGSILAMKNNAAEDPAVRAVWLERLAKGGVPPERVRFLGWTKGAKTHLESYAQVDISLDPFPYNGTTSTCESLLMGVPVVTLVGDSHVSRVGASLLGSAGHCEWVASSIDDYVRIAGELAARIHDVRAGRAALRAQLQASRLMDGPAFATAFERALRHEWGRLCTHAAQR